MSSYLIEVVSIFPFSQVFRIWIEINRVNIFSLVEVFVLFPIASKIALKCPGTAERGESALQGKFYPLTSRGEGVAYWSEKTKREYPGLKAGWWLRRTQLVELENPDSKPFVRMGFRILWEKIYEPIFLSPATMESHHLTQLYGLDL